MELYRPKKDVIHITSDEKTFNYKFEKNSDKLSKNLEIASIDDILSIPIEDRRALFAVREIEEGMIFIKDPITGRYYLASEASQKLRDSKFDALTDIARLLGAKKVVREIESMTQVSRKIDASGKVTYKEVSLKLDSKNESYSNITQKYSRVQYFNGCERSIDFEKAVNQCKLNGLIHEPEVINMLKNRNPEDANYVTSDDLNIELTNDCERSMDNAMSLNVMGNLFKLDAKCQQAITTSTKIRIHWYVEY